MRFCCHTKPVSRKGRLDATSSSVSDFLVSLVAADLLRNRQVEEEVQSAAETQWERIRQLVRAFKSQPPTPQATLDFENALQDELRESGRLTMEILLNSLEPDDAEDMPKQAEFDGQQYSRKNAKTNNRGGVGTLFGAIQLSRYSYEPLSEARDDGQASFAPLEMCLGIVEGNATPALAERVGRAAASHTQQEVLDLLRCEHCVPWSIAVLRKVIAAVSQGIAEHVHAAQKKQLLDWLRAANDSTGRHKITLAVGRDGIMLPIRGEQTYKEGAVATLSVYDRRGGRLGTIYLGEMPESYQTTLSAALTKLITDVLQEWGGPSPRLAYITDAGFHQTGYFEDVLTQMDDPRRAGQQLQWTRIVDFYHASEYLAQLAQVLFDDPRAGQAWQKRMRHWLKHEPNAVFRILHSAAKYYHERRLTAKQRKAYQQAYGYLNKYKAYMDYTAYRQWGLPIGSGVTEAACKMVFTQRFKQSGMAWAIEGGRVILTLRLATLSQVWKQVFHAYLASLPLPSITTQLASRGYYYTKTA